MRHILVILMLVFTAWAFLPTAAQAHGMADRMPASDACIDCAEGDGESAADPAEDQPCHHGAGCAVLGLPMDTATVTLDPDMTRETRSHTDFTSRSALVTRDLPPPRS